MPELSRYLYLAGALPFLFLGTAHALHTPLSADQRRGLTPADPELVRRMAQTRTRLTPRVDMWRAWIGFNLSHSLGAILFGVLVALTGRSEAIFRAEAPLFGPLAMLVSGIYLAIGLKYWFRIPILGCAISFALFVASWGLRSLGAP